MSNYTYLDCENNYIVITPPTEPAIELDVLKSWLRLDPSDCSEDKILNLLVKQAVSCFEAVSRRTLMNTGFKTFRTCWYQFYELRKSKLVTIDDATYNDTDQINQIIDPSNYYNDFEDAYSRLIFNKAFTFPETSDRKDSIEIKFTAGLAATTEDVPADIQMALMEHVTFFYENRGDCTCNDEASTPAAAMKVYLSYKIEEIGR